MTLKRTARTAMAEERPKDKTEWSPMKSETKKAERIFLEVRRLHEAKSSTGGSTPFPVMKRSTSMLNVLRKNPSQFFTKESLDALRKSPSTLFRKDSKESMDYVMPKEQNSLARDSI